MRTAFAYEAGSLPPASRRAQGCKAESAQGSGPRNVPHYATYILYYVGLSGAVENAVLMEAAKPVRKQLCQYLSNFMGTGLFVLSSFRLGTLNGLMLACTRGIYALSVRNMGPMPDTFKQSMPRPTCRPTPRYWGFICRHLAVVFLRRQPYGALVRLFPSTLRMPSSDIAYIISAYGKSTYF